MIESEGRRTELAAAAQEDELMLLVHDPSPRVILRMLDNRNLTEEHVLVIANRKNLPPEVLSAIFGDKRWSESYPVRLALAKNPKTPLFTALSIARFLRLFDLVELARDQFIPAIFRRKLEALVREKIPSLALGTKKSMARVAGGEILLALIKDGYPEVVRNCLNNPYLVESHLYKVICLKTTSPETIRTIAEDRNWSSRYHIKFALIRNTHTPLARTVLFLPGLKLLDLRELYRDPLLPAGVKAFIHRELVERGEDPERMDRGDEERVFTIEEGDLADIEQEMRSYEQAGPPYDEPDDSDPEAGGQDLQ